MSRPKLLFLAQNLPFPPDGGVKARTYNVLRLLARDYDVTAVCFVRDGRIGNSTVRNRIAALSGLAAIEVFEIPQAHHRGRFVMDHLKSLATRRVYTKPMYESRAVRARLQDLLRTKQFAMAHVDTLDLSAHLEVLTELPTACTHHNVESALLRRRSKSPGSPIARIYTAHQARLMEAEEDRWCPRVSLNVFVSDSDRRLVSARHPAMHSTIVPNGVDVEFFRPLPLDEPAVVFVGGTTWFPNRDALRFFASDIKPHLDALGHRGPVRWIGRATPEEQAEYGSAGIELTGYVNDVRTAVGAAGCFVVPLRVGGGTRLKVLDAWAMGKAVVSTSIGCEGLDARDGENILVRDDPREFAKAIHLVLADRALRERISAGARLTAEQTYSWSVIGVNLRNEYFRIMNRSG